MARGVFGKQFDATLHLIIKRTLEEKSGEEILEFYFANGASGVR